jgi:lysozyme
MTINGQFIKGANNRALAFSRATINTPEKAEKALAEDLQVFGRRVLRSLTVPVSQHQFDALVSHTYNTGGSNRLFQLVNRRAPASEIRSWFETRYITGGGVRLQGLVRRRKAEADLFFSQPWPHVA